MIQSFFTTRNGGVSAPPFASFNLGDHVGDALPDVLANRKLLAEQVGLNVSSFAWMRQTHGRNIAVVSAGTAEPIPDTDGLVTATPGVVLVVLVADCVPILLSDAQAGVVAAVHAGREGARKGIAAKAIEVMVGLGADPSRIEVQLGPAACGKHYEVPLDMQQEVDRSLPGSAVETVWGTPGIDVRLGLDRQLRDLGVTSIHHDSRCTIEDEALFSHRRGAPTGRIAGVIWIG